MTKTLGSAALQLYAGVVSMFFPIPAENQPGLIADLEGDPFVGHALSSATCEQYHRYGMFLAPLTAALTTISTVNLYIDVLLSSMTEIKQTAESPKAVPEKPKDPKKVAAGRAGAAARQKRLLEQLQAAKES